ncbi:sulfatase-like hydrolase/transferase [Altererythrobacter sp. Root672]|uniref:sulfatase-like hydrolase/transferase n=1 Tax=Altererythrobacter sp. Root672 TaxID=1736584 RepID=UPI0006F8CC97|nr:sulfatase-like hydrolase/transferase [Altererythrobacter sp. Root672]KRA81447.1 hypothetical protein ASD76_12930 [Altererythrobacter sp. Root672]
MSEPRFRQTSISATLWAKLLLLALYLGFDHAVVGERVTSLGLSTGLFAFLMLYCALVLALCAAALIRSTPLRIATAAVLAVGSVMLHSYEWATGSPLVYEAFEMMVASRGDAGDALSQHGSVLLQAIGAALVLFLAVALPPGRFALRYGLGWIVPAGAVIALAGMLYLRGGEGARALPAPFSPLAQGAIMATLRLTEEDHPRQAVGLAPGPALAAGDVVLVIDESVAANYLDINQRAGVYSGLAEGRPGISIANFGVAASVANCSAGSNRTLRFGGTRANYRRAAAEMPSIWAYAHRSGRRTVYLDGQRSGGELQNLMTPAERAEIDDFVQIGDTPVPERDHRLAQILGERLHNGIAELILVNKVGAHFPVADKFPDAAATFRPLPVRGRTEGITDIASLPGVTAASEEDWRLYRNAYRNTVAWSTGGFFDRLLPRVAGTGAVILYTSDHGQDLHERGGAGGSTHCVPDPRPEEGAVPMVVIAGSGSKVDWCASASANFDGMSHFRLFPTLLALMGYAPEQTLAFYGPTLMSATKDAYSFTPTYNASLGRDPNWRQLNRAELAVPPASDYAQMARIP